MEIIIVAILSIFVITAVVWLLNKILPFKICPICAGVSGTWLWILAGLYWGWLQAENWRLFAAIGMGGSTVGIAYQLEKKISIGKPLLLWKTLFIPAGFIAVYSILSRQLGITLIALMFLLLVVVLFLNKTKTAVPISRRLEELKNKIKNCC